MQTHSRFKYGVIGVFLLVLALAAAGLMIAISDVPSEIFLMDGNSQTLQVGFPFELELEEGEQSVSAVTVQGDSLKDKKSYSLSEPLVISGQEEGKCNASLKVFGVKVKDIQITVLEEVMLVPGGQSIGVMLHTKGALVVGSMNITSKTGEPVNPAKVAGLQAGDIIEKYNGEEIKDAAHLSELINQDEEGAARLSVRRGDQNLELTIYPVQDAEDGLWKLGVWVRDSTLGVGTLTFYDPASGKFAGLGHAITDVDTGKLLTVKDGEIVESDILEVVKGEEGEPGELRGSFGQNDEVIGTISKNTEYGLYGNTQKQMQNGIYGALPAAKRDEVKVGEATLLCTLDDSGVKEYSCKIVKVNSQGSPEQKSFVVQIDDERLLETTGGIVQGMSGSPIIQNGKIVGAVTHVFINDPTQGYGIYLDWMLSEMYSF